MERPDGSTATLIGWILVGIGLIAALFIGSADSAIGFGLSLGIANLGVGLGVLLLSLGYLVRAIWFLPGREIETQKTSINGGAPITRSGEEGGAVCEWCSRTIHLPAQPCSIFSVDQPPVAGSTILDPTCKRELGERSLLI